MIERLNFYDLYGYLLPGAFLLFLLWLPFGAVTHTWPPNEVTSALIAIVVSYIVGHLLQGLTRQILPSDVPGTGRAPSNVLLDEGESPLPGKDRLLEAVRGQLKARIRSEFGLDVSDLDSQIPKTSNDWGQREKTRQQAFFMCRRTVLMTGVPSYAEQFHGLYAFMRGLAGASFVAAVYYVGWSLSGVVPVAAAYYLAPIGILLFAAAIVESRDRRVAGFLMTWVFLAGVALGAARQSPVHLRQSLVFGALVLTFVGYRAIGAYRHFALTFAQTVYRDFLVIEQRAPHVRRRRRHE
jgi:hypothetical protein